MAATENLLITDDTVAVRHVKIPEQAPTLLVDNGLVQRLNGRMGDKFGVRNKDSRFDVLAGGVQYEGTITFVAAAYIPSCSTLTTYRTFLIALYLCQQKSV